MLAAGHRRRLGRHYTANAYVGNGNSITAFTRNADGSLTSLQTRVAGTNMFGVCVSPDGQHVYSVDNSNPNLYQLARGADGTLSALSTPTVSPTSASGMWGIAITPDGKHVYAVSNGGTAGVHHLSRDTSTGLLTFKESFATNVTGAKDLVVSPDGRFLYVTNQTAGNLAVLAISPVSGSLSSVQNLPTLNAPRIPAISADGKSLYVPSQNNNTLLQYSRNTSDGTLTALSPASVAVGLSPRGVCVSPDGFNVYVANTSANTLSLFSRDTSTGKLTATAQSSLTSAGSPIDIVMGRLNNLVYAVQNAGGTVAVNQYLRGPDGVLNGMGTAPLTNTGFYIAVSPEA